MSVDVVWEGENGWCGEVFISFWDGLVGYFSPKGYLCWLLAETVPPFSPLCNSEVLHLMAHCSYYRAHLFRTNICASKEKKRQLETYIHRSFSVHTGNGRCDLQRNVVHVKQD